MKRLLKITGLFLGSLLVAALGVIAFLAGTESGARFVLTRMLPDSVRLGSVEGRLISPLVIEDLRIDTASLAVTVDRAELQWRPRALFSASVQVDRLEADGVSVAARESTPEPPTRDAAPGLPREISLPVAVRVHELVVRDVAYTSSPEAQPVVADSIRSSIGASGTRFELHALDVSSSLFDLQAKGRLTAQGDYPLGADLDLALRPQGYAAVHSRTRLTGSLQSLRIEQAVAAPYNLEADARISDPLEALRIDVDAAVSGAALEKVSPTLPPGILDARVHAEGPLSALVLEVTAGGTYREQEVVAELRSTLLGEELNIDALSLELPAHGARLAGSGNVLLAGAFPLEASLDWRNLEWPLGASPDWMSERGEATVSGSLDDYRVATNARLMLPGMVPLQARVTAHGDRAQAEADLELSTLEGRIEGHASASWRPVLAASAALDGHNVDPGAFSPQWPGRLDFVLRAQANVDAQETHARLETLTVDGELRGLPVEVDGSGSYDAGTVAIERLRADLGSARLTAQGRYADTADLTWSVTSDDLAELLPQASGTLRSRGTVSGVPPRVRVDASLEGSQLGFGGNRAESVDVVADVDLTDRRPSRIDLRLGGIETPALKGDVVSLRVDGKLSEHRVELAADTSRGSADLALDGRLRKPWSSEPAWEFTLTEANVAYGELRPWRLRDAAQGNLSAARVAVQRHCWASGAASLCLEGQRTAERSSGSFALEALGFDHFAGLLPGSVELDGTVSGHGEFSQASGRPLRAGLELRTGAGRLAVSSAATEDEGDGTARTLLDLEPSRVTLALDEKTANASVDLDFSQGRIELEADLAGAAPLLQQRLEGRLTAEVPDISFVAPFAPDVQNLTGRVSGGMDLGGTLANPQLSGAIALEDGALTSNAAGIRLEQISAAIEGRDGDGIVLDASMRSGGGSLALAGELGLGADPAPTTIGIDGENFQLLGTEEARVFVSPDLEIAADSEAVRVTGVVQVPRADITPQKLPGSAVRPSRDVVLVSRDGEPEEAVQDPAGRPVLADVQIVLGDEVRFEGFGLKARFEGDTTIVQQPDEPTAATGEITIAEGEYRAYGQGLVIESGQILFAGGPVTEPALDVRAVRRPEEGILVGTEVRGTLEEPEFTLFSEPSMTQQEQLSYLVLGRSLEEAPEGESSALAQASLALGVKGGNFLAENIGSNLGVDEFSIKSGSGEAGSASDPADAALVIGKYLSPKLYLSYGIGIFDPESVLTMEYEINRRLDLVTESSSESTGADLVYSFERGD